MIWVLALLIFILTLVITIIKPKVDLPLLLGGSNLPPCIMICRDDQEEDDIEEANDVCDFKDNTDYYGNTYKTVRKPKWDDCCFLCRDDPDCHSWTYDKREGVCRLKSVHSSEITPETCLDRVSGTVREKPIPDEPKESRLKRTITNYGVPVTQGYFSRCPVKG